MGLQMMLIKIANFLAALTIKTETVKGSDKLIKNVYDENGKYLMSFGENTADWLINILVPTINVLKTLLVPVIIVIGVVGVILGIVLGVKYAKSETPEEREKTKAHLIGAIIGVVIILVGLVLALIFVNQSWAIADWVDDSTKPESPSQ